MDVRDAALAMNVMKRPDARDWTSLPPNDEDYTAALHQGFTGLRIAWSPRLGYAQVHPEVAAAVRAAVQSLQDAGARVEEVDPGFEDPLEITTGLWFAGSWMVWNTLTPEQQARTDPDFSAQAQLGSQLSALHVQQLHVRRGALGSHMRQFMERYDLLVTPSVAVPAFEIRPPGSVPMSPQAMLAWTPSAIRSTSRSSLRALFLAASLPMACRSASSSSARCSATISSCGLRPRTRRSGPSRGRRWPWVPRRQLDQTRTSAEIAGERRTVLQEHAAVGRARGACGKPLSMARICGRHGRLDRGRFAGRTGLDCAGSMKTAGCAKCA
jgi:hypothetical protein